MSKELIKILDDAGKTDVASAEHFLREELKALQRSGKLKLGKDEELTGTSLELRVQQLFQDAGFNIQEGRPGKEDFVVAAIENDEVGDNLVVEVKSSRATQPDLDDLRQLDDWVFDLSGEEQARKHGLGGGVDVLAMVTKGMISRAKRHPAPHKGVFIFNGAVGTPFSERPTQILHPNQLEFAKKRNFCVIGLGNLFELLDKGRNEAWTTLHETVGEYPQAA